MNKKEISILFNQIVSDLQITSKIELKVINIKRYKVCGTFCMRGNTVVIHINKYHNKDIWELHDTICHELAHIRCRKYHTQRHRIITEWYKEATEYLIKDLISC